MGIVNLTPDSFWAGSRQDVSDGTETAVEHVLALAAAGADLLDLGAESTRSGVLEAVRAATDLPLTVDTRRAATAGLALGAGADAVNDISGGGDPDMLPLVADRGCGFVIMHMQGMPQTMQQGPRYHDVVAEVTGWLTARCGMAMEAGIRSERLVVDPGIGFGKTLEHNLDLMRALPQVAAGRALLLGASRKRFIADLTGAAVDDRLPGSLAALAAAWQGGATLVRVHDVAASVQFLDVMKSIAGA